MPRPYLLDVNVLIALFDQAHVHHSAAHGWFSRAKASGWRTCPLTENGLLRILSHPGYPNDPFPVSELALRLEEFKSAASGYAFWNDDFSTTAWLKGRKLAVGSANLTDAYLLNLAFQHDGTLATFDLRLTPSLAGERNPSIVKHIPSQA